MRVPLLAYQPHEIAPPVQYSLLPPWAIFLAAAIALLILGLLIWLISKKFQKQLPPLSARERALAALRASEGEIESISPYQFSIRVSDILRRYVLEQFSLPMTRQTSVEFLSAITAQKKFTDAEKELLRDFLDRCDLIKFARYQATADDSRQLLEEAGRFVEGGALVTP